jgi:hypothetical protein
VSWLNVHEKEGNARKDAAELAEAQEQAASKRATAYGPLFNSGKLALTKKAGALKLKGWSRRVPVSAPLRPKIGPVLPTGRLRLLAGLAGLCGVRRGQMMTP